MDAIESHVETSSKEYKENFAHYELLVKDLKSKIAIAAKGGGDERIKLHKSRNKMLARERIDALLDPDTPFIEFNPNIRFVREVSKDVIKSNLLKPEVWARSIENAAKLVEKSELGTMVFGSALNLLLFSKTYKDSILKKLKETLEKSSMLY